MSTLSKVKIAVQLWSLNKYEPENFPKVLETVAKVGYDGVEFAGFHNLPAFELKKILAGLNLGIAGSHTGIQLLRDKFNETVDYNLAIGNQRIIIPAVGDDIRGSLAGWKKLSEEILGYQDKLKGTGLTIGYHNHDFEFKETEGKIPFYELFSALPASVQLQLDMGWCFRAGHDARDIFKKFPGRSATVHVKAFCAALDTARVGEDDVDWKNVLPVAVETGKAEWFIVEHERHGENDPIDSIRVCLNFLRNLQK